MGESKLFPSIQHAVDQWCASSGGGFAGCIVMAIEIIDENGEKAVVIADSPEACNHVKVGLSRMLTERFAIESRLQLMSAFYGDDEDDEDE